jgi:3-hydroxymyristoyl/3-hydroxydecanoyl-(acyl carrier protein) dehydratase
MTGLPEVIAQRHHKLHCEVDLLVTPDNPWFEGHFPNQPILPGVVQIGWAVHFAGEIYRISPSVNTLEQIKFKRPIFPNTKLTLHLTPDIERKKLNYDYRDADHLYSSGTLYYEAR